MNFLSQVDPNIIAACGIIVGIVTTIAVGYLYYRLGTRAKRGKAYDLLKEMKKLLTDAEGEYYFTHSIDDNYKVANFIYSHADDHIIATSFNEDPSKYGEADLARLAKNKALFTRITSRETCGEESEKKVRKNMSLFLKGSNFVIIPKGKAYTILDGIFCKFEDDSYLTFFAFRHPHNPQENRGVVFRNGIAKSFFEYYDSLIKLYK
jgi:hypothetical protein